MATRSEKVSVSKHRRGNSWVSPFQRRQKIKTTVDTEKDKPTKAQTALNLAIVGGVGLGVNVALNRKEIGNVLRKYKVGRHNKSMQKYLPAAKRGSGAYGSVQQINENQVNKVFHSNDIFSVKDLNKDIKREFNILKDLQSTGVVPKVGDSSKYGFTMESIKGDTLFDFFNKNLAGASPLQVEALGSSVGSSLKKVHNKGYVHGDLHTNNIFVDNKGKIKFIDFGRSSKSKDTSSDLSRLFEQITSQLSPDNRNIFNRGFNMGYG